MTPDPYKNKKQSNGRRPYLSWIEFTEISPDYTIQVTILSKLSIYTILMYVFVIIVVFNNRVMMRIIYTDLESNMKIIRPKKCN